MYAQHPEFESPGDDAILWRYTSFAKFVSLLHTKALFFVRADKLGDPFEGSYSPINVALRPDLYRDRLLPQVLATMGESFRELRRFHLINFWQESAAESEAMWKIYAAEGDGIAVKTSFQSLSTCFTGEENVYIGRVKYVDYQRTFIPEHSGFAPYLFKRQSFEHEREVRAICVKHPQGNAPLAAAPDICETGLYLAVDLGKLIQEVVVAPFAEGWFLELTQAVATRFGLEAPIRRSSLAELPVW